MTKIQSFNYYHIGDNTKDRLTKSKFNQLPILSRLMHDDVVKGIVHTPVYREDGSNSYYLVMRSETLTKLSFNNPTFGRIPYSSLSDSEFEVKYKMSKTQHQAGHWAWKDKIESEVLCTFVL
jgi:hypothetical protein